MNGKKNLEIPLTVLYICIMSYDSQHEIHVSSFFEILTDRNINLGKRQS